MPLLDHFRPPLASTRHWESFHTAWAAEIMSTLNQRVLPPGYFAEAQVHVGSRVEIDVAAFDEDAGARRAGENGGVATQVWTPPAATMTMPAVFPDEIEVQVYSTATGATLVSAIELVSPGNKDRAESRRAFAAKCASYLAMGVGLVVVDIVTERTANLHDELVTLLDYPPDFRFPRGEDLYAAAYRPVRRSDAELTEVWLERLRVGNELPTMPLALRGDATLPLELEATYTQVRADSRL